MLSLTADELRRCTRGRWQAGDPDISVSGASTDTRSLTPGDVFFALRGPQFDGHDYVEQAFAAGAAVAVVEAGRSSPGAGPMLSVVSPLVALGLVAARVRSHFHGPVVAVVGSAGKTTTKEMIAAVLERRLRVLKTPESENNEIGVPKTLLRLTAEHEAVVLELAARKEGDIRYLCSLVRPTLGVFLNVGRAHLEFFKAVERVAKAKGELLDSIEDESSLALVNADDCVIAGEAKRTKGRLLGFGLTRGSHYSGEGLTLDQEGCGHFSLQQLPFHLQIPGRHNVYNAVAAAAVGDLCGVPWPQIQAALGEFRPVSMRSETLRIGELCVINDCYNANPESVRAALDALASRQVANGRRVAVLGDMLELGEASPALHAGIGRQVVDVGVDLLLATGALSEHTVAAARAAGMAAGAARHFGDTDELAEAVRRTGEPGDVILVKASRGMALDRVVDRIATCS